MFAQALHSERSSERLFACKYTRNRASCHVSVSVYMSFRQLIRGQQSMHANESNGVRIRAKTLRHGHVNISSIHVPQSCFQSCQYPARKSQQVQCFQSIFICLGRSSLHSDYIKALAWRDENTLITGGWDRELCIMEVDDNDTRLSEKGRAGDGTP